MQLPSAADLVRSFVKDLSNVLDVDFSGGKPTLQKTLWSTGAASLSAAANYWIVGVQPLGAGTYCLSFSPSLTAAIIGLANNASYDVICACSTATAGDRETTTIMRVLWGQGTKVYLNTTGGLGLILFLELADT